MTGHHDNQLGLLWRWSFPICRNTPTCVTRAKRRKTGRSSTSLSTTRHSASPAVHTRWAWRSSIPPAASTGSPMSAKYPKNAASRTSTAISARCSRKARWPEPRLNAAMMGRLVKGLEADHVVWGTDVVWTGAPQWQIEVLRRLEIPEDMQKKYGFAPLGAAGKQREVHSLTHGVNDTLIGDRITSNRTCG